MNVEPRPLSGNGLVEAWLRGESVPAFLPDHPGRIETYVARAQEVARRFDNGDRADSARHLRGGGRDGEARLAAFVEERGFMVTTGQQPGLFGGALYALYKGLTAAALARRLEDELERPVLPVFWIASEDHDWDEVRTTHVMDVQNELHEVGLPPAGDGPSPPFHRIHPGPELSGVLEQFLELHPSTDFSEHWRSVLEDAYTPDATLADGFQGVMEALLGPAGVFFVQAHDPELKSRALPTLLRELEESAERAEALSRTADDLRQAGFHVQVPLLEGATNLFLEGAQGRERLFRDDGMFRLRESGRRLSFAEIRERASDDPAALSPNVLLRPVVESRLLPTLSYVAGPGEAAYLAQIGPVFAGHQIERPVVHPRASLFILETKVGKVLDKLELPIEDLARPAHELAGELAREEIPADVGSALRRMREATASGADELQRAAANLDPTLKGAVESFRNRSGGLLDDVEKKIVQSLKRENETVLAQVDKTRRHLFPMGRPQERVLNPFYYLVRYDRSFLDAVTEQARGAILP